VVICQERENEIYFPVGQVLELGVEPYYKRAIKAKLGFWFNRRPIALKRSEQKVVQRLLLEQQIDLLHAHFGTYAVYFSEICKELDIPLLVTFHGHDISSAFGRWPAYHNAFPGLLQQIRYAIVISEEMKGRLLQLGCPEEKVKVSYLGVPLDEFPFFDRTDKAEPVIFLHAGRLTAKKGVPDLVKAFRRAFPEKGAAELWIVGDGEERGLVQQAIDEVGAGGLIQYLGKKSNEELLEIRNRADVFVLNCRTDAAGTKEGLPIATLEAAATGLPAISTYHAGIPESIVDGETGFLVPEFDNEAFAEAMRKMMVKATRLDMGKKAREFMEQKFSLEHCNTALYQVYEQAVNR